MTIRGDAPEERDGRGGFVCRGVDSDSAKKVWCDYSFESSRKVAKTFWAGIVAMSAVLALTGQRQDELKAWATWHETFPQHNQTSGGNSWLSSEERAEVEVERLLGILVPISPANSNSF